MVICQLNNGLKTIKEAKCDDNFYKILRLRRSQPSHSKRSYDRGTTEPVKLHVIDVPHITEMRAIYE
jgi:hypothetical protein